MAIGAPDLGNLSLLLQPIFDAAKTYTSSLVEAGKAFLGLAVLIELVNLIIQFWVKGGANDLIAKLVRLAIVTSIPLAMLVTWPVLPNTLIDFFEKHVSSVFSGVSGDAASQVSTSINHVFRAVWGMSTAVGPANTSGADHWYSLPSVTRAMAHMLIYVVLFIPVLLLVIAMLFAMYGPMLMLYIGVIFGPILVAWLPFEPMSNLATKWLNYMITMGLSFAIGIGMASMMTTALGAFSTAVEQAGGAGDTVMATLAGLLPMVAGIAFIGYMMLKIEHIAAALVGGPSVGGGAGFFGMAAGMAMRGAGGSKKPKEPKTPNPPKTPGGGGGEGGGTASGLSSGAAQTSSAPAPSARGGGRAGGGSSYSPMTPRGGGEGRGSGAPAMAPRGGGGSAASSGASAASAPSSEAPASDSASATKSANEGPGTLGQRFAEGVKSVAGSGPGKLAMFAGAAAVNPVAAVAVGAYAASPAVRSGVNSVAKGVASGGRAVGNFMRGGGSPKPTSGGGSSGSPSKLSPSSRRDPGRGKGSGS